VKTAFTQPGEAQGEQDLANRCDPRTKTECDLLAARTAHGIHLAGTKFMCIQADGEQLLGRKAVS
jgi:hypothetical protein